MPQPVSATGKTVLAHPHRGSPTKGSSSNRVGKISQKGYLTLVTSPVTEVFIKKSRVGFTPLRRHGLTPGRHRLRLKSGFFVSGLTVDVRAGQETNVNKTFRSGRLLIDAPKGTEVYINRRKLGKTPLPRVSLYEGEYLIVFINRKLAKTENQRIRVRPNRVTYVGAKLY